MNNKKKLARLVLIISYVLIMYAMCAGQSAKPTINKPIHVGDATTLQVNASTVHHIVFKKCSGTRIIIDSKATTDSKANLAEYLTKKGRYYFAVNRDATKNTITLDNTINTYLFDKYKERINEQIEVVIYVPVSIKYIRLKS